MNSNIYLTKVEKFAAYLYEEERSKNTVTKYLRDLRAFFLYLKGGEVCKEAVLGWKGTLVADYAPASVNSMLAAVNSFFDWLEQPQLKVKPLKIQRMIYAKPEKELSHAEYDRLVAEAEHRCNRRLSLLLQTICSTGIRISELRFITVTAIKTGRTEVGCKGKNRVVFLPNSLCKALGQYCRDEKLESGPIFRSKSGKPLDRSNIWRDMKTLCESAGVAPDKVFPHNLRHLFARTYYSLERDLSRLADLLGHSNVTTTRIYTRESGTKHIQQLERMGLVLK